MSPRLPALRAEKVITVLEGKAFIQVRQSGSHVILKHPDGRRTTVPSHQGRDLGRGLLRQIMRDAGLSLEDFS